MTWQDDRDGQPRAMDEQLRHALGRHRPAAR